jgi:CHAT domain-containing protein/Tfp pilus assembly protein PilF
VLVALLTSATVSAALTAQDARAAMNEHFKSAQSAEMSRDFVVAIREYQQAARFAERAVANSPEDWILANILNRQANLHAELKQTREAVDCLERSLKIYVDRQEQGTVPEKLHNVGSITLLRLGDLDRESGNYLRGESRLLASLRIRKALGLRDFSTAMAHQNLGYLYYIVGLLDGDYAEKHLTEAKVIFDTLQNPPLEKAIFLNNFALLRFDQGRYSEAKAMLNECISILQPAAPDHEFLGKAYGSLGWLLHQQGDFNGAQANYDRSIAVCELRKGKSSRDHARTLSNIGWLKQSLGDFAAARKFYQQSLAMRTDDLQRLALSKANLALLEGSAENWGAAFDHMEDALKTFKRFMARTLPTLPERLQISIVLDDAKQDSLASFLHSALSLAYEGRKHPDATKRAATWLLNCKAIAYQALTSRERAARDAALKGDQYASKFLQVRQDLASLALLKNTLSERNNRQTELESLASFFGKAATELSGPDLERWVDVGEVQAALGRNTDATLVEYARFKRWDFQSTRAVKGGEERYAALVIASKGDVRLVDLGTADKIDGAMVKLTTLLTAAENDVKATGHEGALLDPAKVTQAQAVLKDVAERVLWPVMPHLDGRNRWIISPDHQLWFVPWSALPDDKGTSFVVQSHTISCLLSGRELLNPKVNGAQKPPLMLAFPNYNLGAKQARARLLPALDRLEGTKKEAQEIEPFLHKLHPDASVVQFQDALEGLVKRSASPRVLYLATHGFFLDQAFYGNETPPPNALLRCGVALAGCNTGADGQGQDGILTGEEVLGLDLRGTELVVLSACQTGVGKVQSGEGVASMRQAFHLAGSRSVLASLWPVPDKQTKNLLAAYFQELVGNGKDKAEALALAQRKLIEDFNVNVGAGTAHPFLWAAFTLTGDPGGL